MHGDRLGVTSTMSPAGGRDVAWQIAPGQGDAFVTGILVLLVIS